MTGQTFPLQVLPQLPAKIARLEELSSNFWFSWHRPTRRLFGMLDAELWWKTARNPMIFLRCVDQGILETAATNETFLGAYRRVLVEFDAYHEKGLTAYQPAGLSEHDLVAYFCAEYGYHESFPNYSGGLGILAGDHCKTASDLRLPFVAIGLLYRRGYFQPAASTDTATSDRRIPAHRSGRHAGHAVAGRKRQRHPRLLRLPRVAASRSRSGASQVGRVRVSCCSIPASRRTMRRTRKSRGTFTAAATEMRVQQEIILGIGGVRALRSAPAWRRPSGTSTRVIRRSRCSSVRVNSSNRA